jgi:diguanylate cyclase (GGDEF)-like protein/PAS domain S-box-containing protein
LPGHKKPMSQSNATSTPPPFARNHRVAHALATASLLIAAVAFIITGVLFSSYRATVERELTNLQNLAGAFAAQTRFATRSLELVLNNTERSYLRASRGRHAGNEAPDLSQEPGAPESLLGVYLYAPDGELLARELSHPMVPAPPAPPRTAADQLHIAVANVDRSSGRATIHVSRAVLDGAGRVIGSILAQSDSSYFQHIFSSANLGTGGSVTLLHRDGTMLLRGPPLPGAIGRSFRNTPLFQRYLPGGPQGAFEATSPTDGTRRLYGYSSVEGYPLVIITGRDKSDTLRVWRAWLWTGCIFLALFALTLLFLAWRVGREASMQAALIGRLGASEARLAHGSRYLNSIIDALASPLWVLDTERRILMFNEAFARFAGRSGSSLAGVPEAQVLDAGQADSREELYERVLAGGGMQAVESDLRDGDGQVRTVIQLAARLESEDHQYQIVNTLTDISERKRVEMRLAYLAEFDLLTELPNQDQFRRMLQEAMAEAGPRGERLAVLVVALERLQEVVDLLGHDAGDEIVRAVGDRLRALPPEWRCIARVKNNEFALLLPMPAGPLAVDEFALELLRVLSQPVTVRGREFYLGPLVGIALFPQDASSVHELLRLADIAKHRAGAEGGEPVHFYSERTHTLLNERLTIEEQLRRALERNELRVVYQPKVDIRSGQVTGFEALLRWSSPTLGTVGPASFIPIAENTGLIVPIGAWVLATACAAASGWARELGQPVKVAVNLSIRQFHQKDLVPVLRQVLADTGMPPASLELEITESTAMSGREAVDALLAAIRELGVELSIDDFGTGYSSLAYLKRFPVQRLKVDRAFVHDLGRDGDSSAIIRAIVTLGHGLQMRIVAEGVETDAQLALLRELDCDEYQGYLFSRPVEAAEVVPLLRANASHVR